MLRFGSLIRRQFSKHQFPKYRFFSDESERYPRPLSTEYDSSRDNCAHLTGIVDGPIRIMNTGPERFGVSTMLKVRDPEDPNQSFRVLLKMWDGMARKCIKHVKQNDLIHVSGRADSSFDKCPYWQVIVKEFNYVVDPPSDFLESQISPKSESETAGEDRKEEKPLKKDDVHLWQLFFLNPDDWWDNRNRKKNPRQPDFKHKDTGESLWLSSNMPIRFTKQLEQLDQMRKARNAEKERNDDDSFSKWD